jgi:hypothetical protein
MAITLIQMMERARLALAESAAIAAWALAQGGTGKLLLQQGFTPTEGEMEQAPALNVLPGPCRRKAGGAGRTFGVVVEGRVRNAGGRSAAGVTQYPATADALALEDLVVAAITAEFDQAGLERPEVQSTYAAGSDPALVLVNLVFTYTIAALLGAEYELEPRPEVPT